MTATVGTPSLSSRVSPVTATATTRRIPTTNRDLPHGFSHRQWVWRRPVTAL